MLYCLGFRIRQLLFTKVKKIKYLSSVPHVNFFYCLQDSYNSIYLPIGLFRDYN